MISLLLSHLSNFNFISWFIIILTEDLLILFIFLKSHMPPMIEDIFLQCCFKRPSSHHPSVSCGGSHTVCVHVGWCGCTCHTPSSSSFRHSPLSLNSLVLLVLPSKLPILSFAWLCLHYNTLLNFISAPLPYSPAVKSFFGPLPYFLFYYQIYNFITVLFSCFHFTFLFFFFNNSL